MKPAVERRDLVPSCVRLDSFGIEDGNVRVHADRPSSYTEVMCCSSPWRQRNVGGVTRIRKILNHNDKNIPVHNIICIINGIFHGIFQAPFRCQFLIEGGVIAGCNRAI